MKAFQPSVGKGNNITDKHQVFLFDKKENNIHEFNLDITKVGYIKKMYLNIPEIKGTLEDLKEDKYIFQYTYNKIAIFTSLEKNIIILPNGKRIEVKDVPNKYYEGTYSQNQNGFSQSILGDKNIKYYLGKNGEAYVIYPISENFKYRNKKFIKNTVVKPKTSYVILDKNGEIIGDDGIKEILSNFGNKNIHYKSYNNENYHLFGEIDGNILNINLTELQPSLSRYIGSKILKPFEYTEENSGRLYIIHEIYPDYYNYFIGNEDQWFAIIDDVNNINWIHGSSIIKSDTVSRPHKGKFKTVRLESENPYGRNDDPVSIGMLALDLGRITQKTEKGIFKILENIALSYSTKFGITENIYTKNLLEYCSKETLLKNITKLDCIFKYYQEKNNIITVPELFSIFLPKEKNLGYKYGRKLVSESKVLTQNQKLQCMQLLSTIYK